MAQYNPYGGQQQQQQQFNPYSMVDNTGYAQPVQPIKNYQADTKMIGSMTSPVSQTMTAEPGDIGFLAGKRRFFIKQRFEMLESIANTLGVGVVEFSNKYDFFDADTGEPMLFAAEQSNCLCRGLCKPNHPATLTVFDVRSGSQTPLFTMKKPFTCNCCACAQIFAQNQVTTTLKDNQVVGSATKHIPCGGGFTPQVDIKDKLGNDEYIIKGPCCIFGGLIELFRDMEFKMFDTKGTQVGRVVKMKPEGGTQMLQEAVGDSDRYLFEFDSNLDAEKTANLLGTLLLLDYMFFESGPPCQFVNGALQYNCCDLYLGGFVCACTGQLGGNSSAGN